ncbi:MAG: NnrS family protein [Gammaproteobacteria bacterium]
MTNPTAARRRALWQLGFRPFFLAAGSFAALAMLAWTGMWLGEWPRPALPPVQWHAHEMIYGYAFAVVAGFLLTAVRNWTGIPTPDGLPLATLVASWLCARVLLLMGPDWLLAAAAFDLVFGAALLLAVARPVVRVRQWRQSGIMAKLLLLVLANALFYAGALGHAAEGMYYALYGGVFVLVALILTMAGRVMPGFIERGVRVPVSIHEPRWVSGATLLLFLGLFVAELFLHDRQAVAVCALGLAIVTAVRLRAWHTPGLWREPLLWGLFLALVAIEAGFVLYALAGWLPIPRTLALHAFAAGGIGLTTLAMMARVALGHTGRDIRQPPRSVGWALGLLLGSVVTRVGMPLLMPASYVVVIAVSQALWIAAFVVFVAAYAPILLAPRVDGTAG